MKKLEEYVVSIPDYPEKGIIFRDVTSILEDPEGLQLSIRELQDKLYGGRHAATKLDGSPDFMLLAEAYGIPSLSIREDSQTEEAIAAMLSADGPFLLQCIVHPDEPSL